MKELTLFYLDDCGYCAKAKKALEELYKENPAYREIPITKIEESRNPEIADQYDYYAVPTFFDGKKKLFEAHLFMSYEEIRDEVKRVLDYALGE
ncbi:MAG: thioredoxin family protein [Lachnospiraceae bacterium]|nr:thioredoxin family protein [Lachnospiraceae bacterium]